MQFEFQAKKQYQGVIHAIHGDFVKNGSSQYLLLKQNLSEGRSWVLTDLQATYLSSDDLNGKPKYLLKLRFDAIFFLSMLPSNVVAT